MPSSGQHCDKSNVKNRHLHQCGLEECDWHAFARRRSFLVPHVPRSRINSAICLRPSFGDSFADGDSQSDLATTLRKAQSADHLPTRVHLYTWHQEPQLPIVAVSIASDSEATLLENNCPTDVAEKRKREAESTKEDEEKDDAVLQEINQAEIRYKPENT